MLLWLRALCFLFYGSFRFTTPRNRGRRRGRRRRRRRKKGRKPKKTNREAMLHPPRLCWWREEELSKKRK